MELQQPSSDSDPNMEARRQGEHPPSCSVVPDSFLLVLLCDCPEFLRRESLAQRRALAHECGLLPMAMAVFPVPGWPAMRTARPAIFPSRIISSTTPAARRAASCPTMP